MIIFSLQLNKLILKLGLSSAKIAELTGESIHTINEYLSGARIPPDIKNFSKLIGVNENYFNDIFEEAKVVTEVFNVPVTTVAKLMHKSPAWVMKGLQDKVFPWGYAVKVKNRWSYYISSSKFEEHTNIKIKKEGGGNYEIT